MIGILAKDNHFHVLDRGELESLEYLRAGRENDPSLRLLPVELPGQGGEIRLLELRCESFFPTFLNLHVHDPKYSELIEDFLYHVVDCLYIMERQAFDIDWFDVLDILAVVLGNHYLMDSGPLSGKDLLFYATYRKHPSP